MNKVLTKEEIQDFFKKITKKALKTSHEDLRGILIDKDYELKRYVTFSRDGELNGW